MLKDWSIRSRLSLVACPALVLAGEHDTMTVECSQAVVDGIPHARPLVIIAGASHMKLLEEPEVCIKHIAAFLKSI